MKLNEQLQAALPAHLLAFLRDTARKVNQIASGAIAGRDNAMTAPPVAGTWAQGDEVRNSAPTELGAAGSRYVVLGWVCIAGGAPGTWREIRTMTGN